MKKVLMLIILLITVLLVVSCTNKVQEVTDVAVTEGVESSETVTATTGIEGNSVIIENGKFMPTDLLVEAGTTVEWINKDSVDHTVTFENGDLDEKMVVGATTTYTFTEAGTFRYFCQFHPGMQGSVIVS